MILTRGPADRDTLRKSNAADHDATDLHVLRPAYTKIRTALIRGGSRRTTADSTTDSEAVNKFNLIMIVQVDNDLVKKS